MGAVIKGSVSQDGCNDQADRCFLFSFLSFFSHNEHGWTGMKPRLRMSLRVEFTNRWMDECRCFFFLFLMTWASTPAMGSVRGGKGGSVSLVS